MCEEKSAEIEARPDEKRRTLRRMLLASLPLPYVVVAIFVTGYLFEGNANLELLIPLALLGLPVSVIVAGVVGALAPTWGARARLWALTLVCAGLSCAVLDPVAQAASNLYERRTIASRADALRAFAQDPAHRARVATAEEGLWLAGARGSPVLDGHAFERVAFTSAGAWFLVRPAFGIHWGWGIYVPYADVNPAQVGVGSALKPEWVTDLEPSVVPGFFRFRTPDGMSGGGGDWTLHEAYSRGR